MQAAEPFKNGPYAEVNYVNGGLPCVEFTFTYKSMGTPREHPFLIVDLLQALGIAMPMPKDVTSTVCQRRTFPARVEPRKRPHDDEETRLREENKKLKASSLSNLSENVDGIESSSTATDRTAGKDDFKAPPDQKSRRYKGDRDCRSYGRLV